MNAIAERQPSAGAGFERRTLLAGGAATAALIGAVAVALITLAAYVAFEGFPGAGAEAEDGTVQVGGPGSELAGAPEAAASLLAAAPRALADGRDVGADAGAERGAGSGGDVNGAGSFSTGAGPGAAVGPALPASAAPRSATAPQDSGVAFEALGETAQATPGAPLSDVAAQLTKPVESGLGAASASLGIAGLEGELEGAVDRILDR